MARSPLVTLLLCAAFTSNADDLLLAPGKSVTLLDAADPTTSVVITAPPNAPLNLSTLLNADPKESMRSVVTRIQLQQARGLTANPDGSISLGGAAQPGAAARATVLEGGVLVYNAGRYTVYPATQAAAPAGAPAGPAGRAQISKPGTTREQAGRDMRQCQAYADGAAAHFFTAAHKNAMYNMAMASCLRGFGYEIRSPAG